MLYREIIAVCSEIHTKHINTLCGQNVELLNVNLAVHVVTTEVEKRKNKTMVFVLSKCCKISCEKLIDAQLLKEFIAFFGNPKLHYNVYKDPPLHP
jgi:hypothetical protein